MAVVPSYVADLDTGNIFACLLLSVDCVAIVNDDGD